MSAAPAPTIVPLVEQAAFKVDLAEEQEAKYERITRRLQEVTSAEIMRKVLSENRSPVGYWGSAITGRPHIAYCVPFLKIADFLTAGVRMKILLADLHGFLDANKSNWADLEHRTVYYSKLIHAVFTTLGVPVDKLEFVRGSSYELKPEYTLDMYKFHSLVTTKQAEHAGADVVKASESPLMNSLLYPGLQALDEEYLGVDFQFGGVDQRKIFMYAAEYLPKLGYSKRTHLMNIMVPGLSGGKMSSSEPKSKIDFLDSPADVKSKLKAAVCAPGDVDNNGVLAFVRAVLIPCQDLWEEQARARGEAHAPRGPDATGFVSEDAPVGTIFSIARPEKFGGNLHFPSYQALEDAYRQEALHPQDLKSGVEAALNILLAPIQKKFWADEEWQRAEKDGYKGQSVSEVVAKQVKAVPVKKADKPAKGERTAPPSEEERAALRAKKEADKAAKAQAQAVAANKGDAAASAGSSSVIRYTNLPDMKLLSKGKVRDIYALPDEKDSDKLLFVATDRISAYDVIMENGIPQKGVTLTTLSLFWFHQLAHIIPNHVVFPSITSSTPACLADPKAAWSEFPRNLDAHREQLEGRSMIVRKSEVVKIEAIVRGYITGSAWSEYKKSGTVHGIQMPDGLVESQKLPKAIFTPSTKADLGEHDENIHPDKVKDICGPELAEEIERVALQLYNEAAAYALERGLILADTKFEFGLLPSSALPSGSTNAKSFGGKSLILIDEALTPDSSRYWSAADYVPGKSQSSFDKQYLRDWLTETGNKHKEGVSLPDEVVSNTRAKYEEAKDRVMRSA